MAAADCHKLSIVGTGSSYKDKEGRQAWKADIFLDDKPIHRDHEIYDPCSEEEHVAIIEHLEQLLPREYDFRSTATKVSTIIDTYRTKLFAQLDLGLLLPKTRIQIEVCDGGDQVQAPQTHTLHRLQWELLEDPHHWNTPDPYVTLRRKVAPAVAGPNLERVCSWSTSDSINILLVVARRLDLDASRGNEGVIRSSALPAIQKTQRRLNTRQGSPRINLERVRSGTYQALQTHLEKTTREKGPGYFHMVHFDLHGRVNKHTAYLRFAKQNGRFDDKPAADVAELLAANGVSAAIINACDSGTASKGVDANLSRIFAQKNIFNILAMSYKISSSAATMYFTHFYKALLIETLPFSEAASRARKALREQKEREGPDSLRCHILDWFVPVVYTGHRDLQITPRSSPLLPSTIPAERSLKIRDYWTLFIWRFYWWLLRVWRLISRLLTICSSAVFSSLYPSQSSRGATRRFPLTDQAKCRPQMIWLDVETFDDDKQAYQNPWYPLALDGFVMEFEHKLDHDHHTYLHGPPKAGKSFLLDQLSHSWLSTNITQRVYVIQSSMFLEGWIPTLWRCLLHSIQGHSRYLYATAHLPRNEDSQDEGFNAEPRVTVIVDHVDELFSKDLTRQQKAQAKVRIDAFLSKVVGVTRGRIYTRRPRLILVGRQGDDWLHEHFDDSDFDLTPIFLPSRPALQHLQ